MLGKRFVLVVGCMWVYLITMILFRWTNPLPPVVRVKIESPYANSHPFCWIGLSPDESVTIYGMYIVGSPEFNGAVQSHQLPPRCRNVPDGAGCIDWLEPGESDWNKVFKARPKLTNLTWKKF